MTSNLVYGILINRIKGGDDMEFLYKLYSNEYFGIGLFIVISILAFSFLVILFFGKKDEKARKAMENQVEEEKKEEVVSENLETITLNEDVSSHEEENVEEEVNPKEESQELETFEEKKIEDIDPFVTSNLVLNTDYINEEMNEPDLKDTSDIYNLDFVMQENLDFASEEESIDEVLKKYDQQKETEDSYTFGDIPVIQEEEPKNIFAEEENTKVTSAPFSSVYLEKDVPEISKNEEELEKKTEPAFELPKRVDLPKRNDNASNDNIISFMNEEK